MESAEITLIAARENEVYRATDRGASYAIRLHRKGYRTDAELSSELAWMNAVACEGISVPAPIAALSGRFLEPIAGTHVDVLSWLPGEPLSTPSGPLSVSDRAGTFHQLGREMARLHEVSDAWTPPAGFTRCSWDREGLLGETPLWDRFWDNPGLSAPDRSLMLAFRTRASEDLRSLEDRLDFGLIHADLVTANVMSDDGQISLIDFDDGGFGFRLFEISTALLKQMPSPDYPALRAALLSGYHSVRDLDVTTLDLFLAIRATTYVGWNITRMHENDAEGRNTRFIETACRLARGYLNKA